MRSKLLFPAGIAAIVITVVLTGWLAFSGHGQTEATCTLNVPEEVASLPRTEFVSGPEAISQIAVMHGKDINLKEGHIAKYQALGQEIMLWISVSPTRKEGEQLFRSMDDKMPASEVFTNRQEVEIRNRKIIKVDGMGQQHYYWVSGMYNYWVAAGGIDGKVVVEELLLKVE